MQEYREKRKSDALQQLGGRCVRCGSVENLHFDHIDPASKVNALSRLLQASKKRFEEELSKCQLLCETHHRAKTQQQREAGQKLSLDEAEALRADREAGMSFRALGRKYGIHPKTVHNVIIGKTYKRYD